jgi:hypothetical protein
MNKTSSSKNSIPNSNPQNDAVSDTQPNPLVRTFHVNFLPPLSSVSTLNTQASISSHNSDATEILYGSDTSLNNPDT